MKPRRSVQNGRDLSICSTISTGGNLHALYSKFNAGSSHGQNGRSGLCCARSSSCGVRREHSAAVPVLSDSPPYTSMGSPLEANLILCHASLPKTHASVESPYPNHSGWVLEFQHCAPIRDRTRNPQRRYTFRNPDPGHRTTLIGDVKGNGGRRFSGLHSYVTEDKVYCVYLAPGREHRSGARPQGGSSSRSGWPRCAV